MEAAHRLLQRRQREVLWGCVQRLLEAEAAEADAGGSGHVLAAELVRRASQTCQLPTAALGPLLLSLYLKAVDGAPYRTFLPTKSAMYAPQTICLSIVGLSV